MVAAVSVFTAAHNAGMFIERPWRSLIAQSLPDWEWVVVDDAPGHATAKDLAALRAGSSVGDRVRVFARPQTGSIGASKATAANLCGGEILVELDHDDELLPTALETVVAVFNACPDVDFVYSDWIDVVNAGEEPSAAALYPEGWAFGFGAYATELIGRQRVPVALAPAITWETVRHIVSMPNHLRAWRASSYRRFGGHDPSIAVGDDYEILVRTFLAGNMAHIPRPLYVQYHDPGGSSASRVQNARIQDVVADVSAARASELDARCRELGVVPNGESPLTGKSPLSAANFELDPLSLNCDGAEPVSFAITTPGREDDLINQLRHAVRRARKWDEVLVVGLRCAFLDSVVEEHGDARVRSWNLDIEPGDVAGGLNYARRAMARTSRLIVCDAGRDPSSIR